MIHVFIVNPIACEPGFAQKLRKTLEQFPKLSSYVFSTRKQGHEKELVELLCRFFDNEELRFYCCGGSGTLRNMLSGFRDMSKAEVTMVPFGSSDFIKVFTDDYSLFRNIRSLIYGEVVYVDYIKTNMGPALNELSFGVPTDSLRLSEEIRSTSLGLRHAPYVLSTLYGAFFSPNRIYDIRVDGFKVDCEKTTTMFFTNGSVIGGKYIVGQNEIVDDGYASFAFIPGKSAFQRIGALNAAIAGDRKKFKSYGKTGLSKKIFARRTNGSAFYVNLDGEIFLTTELKAEVIRQGLKFVIPKIGV